MNSLFLAEMYGDFEAAADVLQAQDKAVDEWLEQGEAFLGDGKIERALAAAVSGQSRRIKLSTILDSTMDADVAPLDRAELQRGLKMLKMNMPM